MSDSDSPSLPDPLGISGGEAGAAAVFSAASVVGPSWQEQDGTLRDMWMQNKTPQEISAALGRSVAAIMTRAARLGLPRRAAPGRKPGSSRRASDQASAAARTMPRQVRSAHASDAAVPQPSQRMCLMCLRSFQSMGRHNRICPSCKSSSEYGSAASIPDIHLPL